MSVLFTDQVPLFESLAFESEYPRALRMGWLRKMLVLRRAIAVGMRDASTGRLVGETYAVALRDVGEKIPGLSWLALDPARWAYVHSTTIVGTHRGAGLARRLKARLYDRLAGRFDGVVGHARSGRSQRLNLAFGAEIVATFEDWYGTGEAYHLYRLSLDRWRQDLASKRPA